MGPIDVIVGVIGVILLAKLIFGSIAAGMSDAGDELSGLLDEGRNRNRGGLFQKPLVSSAFGLGGSLMVGFFLFRLFFGSGPGEKNVAKEPSPPWEARDLQPEEAHVPTLEESEEATAASVAKVERAAIKVRQREVISEAKGVLEMVKAWTEEMDAWDALMSNLNQGEAGRALASQGHLVKRYRAIIEGERPSREEAETVRAAASDLLVPIQAALEDPIDAVSPAPEISEQLAKMLEKAKEGRDAYRKPRIQVEVLVSTAAAAGGAGGRTLPEVIREQEEEEAVQATTLIEAEIAKAEEEKTKAIAEASRLRVEAEKRAEVNRINAETEAARLLGEQEAARIRDEAAIALAEMKDKAETRAFEAREALRREAFEREWPSMQSSMVPFTSTGYTQPGNDGYQSTTVEGPVSFAALKGSGYLNDHVDSLRNFQYKTRTQSRRPQGAFPWTLNEFDKDQPALQKIQSFLREYGDIMVEKGYLAE